MAIKWQIHEDLNQAIWLGTLAPNLCAVWHWGPDRLTILPYWPCTANPWTSSLPYFSSIMKTSIVLLTRWQVFMKPFHLHIQSENKWIGDQDDFPMFEFQVGHSLPFAFIWEMVVRSKESRQSVRIPEYYLRDKTLSFPCPAYGFAASIWTCTLFLAWNERIQGNIMKCSVANGCRLSKFPKTTRIESWKKIWNEFTTV